MVNSRGDGKGCKTLQKRLTNRDYASRLCLQSRTVIINEQEEPVSPRLNRDGVGTILLPVYDTTGMFACNAVNRVRSWSGSGMISITFDARCGRYRVERVGSLTMVHR